MHSVNAPEEEAKRLYVDQSRFGERILEPDAGEWTIWDVGLGAATNVMGLITTYEKWATEKGADRLRPVHIISFERDLDPLRLAFKHSECFPQLRHSAPAHILKTGEWKSKTLPLKWTLVFGDFSKTLRTVTPPDVIFYDPFSFKTDSLLWSWSFFQELYSVCAEKPTELYTYSASTAVRAGLLGAGFYVARGVGTGPKKETTIALTHSAKDSGHELLNNHWLGQWERSSAQYPIGLLAEEYSLFREKLYSHGQLSAIST